jgi:hypothetical protein
MNTLEIINHRKEGTLEAHALLLMLEGSGLKEIYGKVMAMFLKQGIMIERVFLQVKGKDLALSIQGLNGNILYLELPGYVDWPDGSKITFPVKGDFLLAGKSDGKFIRKLIKEENNGLTGDTRANDGVLTMISPRSRGSRYGNQTLTGSQVQNYATGNLYANIGISSLTLPIIWSDNKGSLLHIKGLVTNTPVDSQNNRNNRRNANLTDAYLRAKKKPLEIPIMFHIQQTGNAYGTGTVPAVNLVCTHNKSIVKDALPKNLDIGNLAFLYELPVGTISSIIGKGNKKRPFGELLVCYDSTGDKLNVVCRTVNATVSDGIKNDTTVETKRLDEEGNLVYTNTNSSKGVSTISYSTWFDLVQTARSGTLSFAPFPGSMEGEVNELFGVSNNGDIVYGLRNHTMTILTTISIMGKAIQFEPKLLETLPSIVKKRTKKVAKTYNDKLVQALEEREKKPRLLKRLNTLITKLNESDDYKKWKAVSDAECERLGHSKEYELEAVFLLYLKTAETVTIEDVTEFNKLK